MKLAKPGQLRSFAAYPRCSTDSEGPMRGPRIAIAAAVVLASCCIAPACRTKQDGEAKPNPTVRADPPMSPATTEERATAPASPSLGTPCVRPGGPVSEPRRLAGKPVRVPASVQGVRTAGSTLIYEATIGEDGQVRDVRLLRPLPAHAGYPEMDRAAREALLTWRYAPTVVDGRAVPVCLSMSVTVEVR